MTQSPAREEALFRIAGSNRSKSATMEFYNAAGQRLGLRELGVPPGERVLDAACGIGTQIIGLAERGYRVRASHISPVAVARARVEMAARGLHAEFAVTDLRRLSAAHAEPVSAILACDNAVPHLLCDEQIRDRRLLSVQAWEWDGDQYDIRLYLTEEHADGSCDTQLLRSRFDAISVGRLLQLMREAGFVETERRDGVLFQPVLVGLRPLDGAPKTGLNRTDPTGGGG